MICFSRIYHLLVKEIFILLKDPKVRFMMIGPPLIQLLIFSYATTLELNHVNIAILNHDPGARSQDLMLRLAATPFIETIYYEHDLNRIQNLLDEQQILAALIIDEHFSQDLDNKQGAQIQCLSDGRKSNASQIFVRYLQNLVEPMMTERVAHDTLQIRYWFNENLLALWGTIPSLVMLIAMLMGLMITSLSISREREMGTLDALLVSPIRDYEIVIAKAVPGIMIGIFQSMLMAMAGVYLFQVPFRGDIGTLMMLSFCFVYSIVGLGLSLSAYAKTQQQSIIGVFLIMVPCVTLSGYAAPIANMPLWMQYLSAINPLRYGIVSAKAIFLKGISLQTLWPTLLFLLSIGTLFLGLAVVFFQKNRNSL